MTPRILLRYKGFLVRVVENGCASHPYEWTVEGITSKTRPFIAGLIAIDHAHLKHQRMLYRRPQLHIYPTRRVNNRRFRLYDPTSMRTLSGHKYSALWWGKDEVDTLTGIFNKPRFRKRRTK